MPCRLSTQRCYPRVTPSPARRTSRSEPCRRHRLRSYRLRRWTAPAHPACRQRMRPTAWRTTLMRGWRRPGSGSIDCKAGASAPPPCQPGTRPRRGVPPAHSGNQPRTPRHLLPARPAPAGQRAGAELARSLICARTGSVFPSRHRVRAPKRTGPSRHHEPRFRITPTSHPGAHPSLALRRNVVTATQPRSTSHSRPASEPIALPQAGFGFGRLRFRVSADRSSKV